MLSLVALLLGFRHGASSVESQMPTSRRHQLSAFSEWQGGSSLCLGGYVQYDPCAHEPTAAACRQHLLFWLKHCGWSEVRRTFFLTDGSSDDELSQRQPSIAPKNIAIEFTVFSSDLVTNSVFPGGVETSLSRIAAFLSSLQPPPSSNVFNDPVARRRLTVRDIRGSNDDHRRQRGEFDFTVAVRVGESVPFLPLLPRAARCSACAAKGGAFLAKLESRLEKDFPSIVEVEVARNTILDSQQQRQRRRDDDEDEELESFVHQVLEQHFVEYPAPRTVSSRIPKTEPLEDIRGLRDENPNYLALLEAVGAEEPWTSRWWRLLFAKEGRSNRAALPPSCRHTRKLSSRNAKRMLTPDDSAC